MKSLVLAKEFCNVINSRLTPEQVVEVIARNKAEKDRNICHTHDFCPESN